ncbi:MAG: 50S ribosomal protein L32 [Actinobacteria bacterium]|nr:50S ribosomal protein L32 [Actinomycetota bacterium]
MPVPKRRKPKSRTRSRKAQWRNSGSVPAYATCPQCHQTKLPHQACGNCGTYAGRQALPVE